MRDVYILSAVRTPIGAFGGGLAPLGAAELGTIAAKEAISKSGVSKDAIDEVVVGNVLSAGLGQNVARQIALNAGLPDTVPAMSINKVCGSGLRALSLAAGMISSGECDAILAGGTESMSNAPYLLHKHRFGAKMGHETIVDSMINDGLWDVFGDYHMGITAENIAETFGISRGEQDAFALESQHRAEAAVKAGRFQDEIVPVTIAGRKGDTLVENDESPRFGATIESLSKLRPAFKKDGTVTAGNASSINDGAAMLVLADGETVRKAGLTPPVRIRAYASAGVDPAIMGYGVVPAVRKTLERANASVSDIDRFELNEAFAAQAIAVTRELGVSSDRVNVNGGAVALGHPIGASGARILVTLVHELLRSGGKTGVASLCIGGGMGTAMMVEIPQ
ncbi:acetyl-CoA C-acetyltransferase [Oscillospiraceae bacterium OttesenSCG-928-G22]|nr:acetyl-CoA C-acetyltransferase [Oscillospiraceae bacterium OttesenSCG-928-G22]